MSQNPEGRRKKNKEEEVKKEKQDMANYGLLKMVAQRLPLISAPCRGIILTWHQLSPKLEADESTLYSRHAFLAINAPHLKFRFVDLWARHPPGKLIEVEEKFGEFTKAANYDDSLAEFSCVFPCYGDETIDSKHKGILFLKE